MFVTTNHNETVLGEFKTMLDALDDASFYSSQTGNTAYINHAPTGKSWMVMPTGEWSRI